MPSKPSKSENSSDGDSPDLFADFDFDSPKQTGKERAPNKKREKSSGRETGGRKSGSSLFRVIHTADWHLGKTLCDLFREEEHDRFLAFLLTTIQGYAVDLLIIAGDVFDSSNPPQSALKRYYGFLSELFRTANCTVVVIAGNHDSPLVLEAPSEVLDPLRVKVVGELRENPEDALIFLPNREEPRLVVGAVPFLRDRDVRVGVPGQSESEVRAALRAGIKKCYDDIAGVIRNSVDPNIPALATGHLTVSGSKLSDSEREIHIGGLGSVGSDIFDERFCYVALGHLHRPQVSGGDGKVCYSGSPIPLSFSEAGDVKELRLLEFNETDFVESRSIPIPESRGLIQIRCLRSELESTIQKFAPPKSDLTPWVEFIIEDPVRNENLFEIVRELVGDESSYEVLHVVSQRLDSIDGLFKGDTDVNNPLEIDGSILDDPSRVFQERLERENGLTDGEKEELGQVFEELLDIYRDPVRREGRGTKA